MTSVHIPDETSLLLEDLVEDNWPQKEKCIKMMGNGHLGIIPLPTTEDSYEQPSINFYAGYKQRGQF